MRPPKAVVFDDDPRIALIAVNFSTTRWLKLMLLTLCEQDGLHMLSRIVIVDNGSRDGGATFLRQLEPSLPCVGVVYRERRLHHGPGLRAGVSYLDQVIAEPDNAPNILLFCDTDIIFRSPTAISAVADGFLHDDVGFVGEVRNRTGPSPDIQASFLAVRRDVYALRHVSPVVHSGSPTRRLQESALKAGYTVAHIPSNQGELILHRGRAGVDAASRLHPRHQYSAAEWSAPHYMGVSGGAAIWRAVEEKYSRLLGQEHEQELVVHLAEKLLGGQR